MSVGGTNAVPIHEQGGALVKVSSANSDWRNKSLVGVEARLVKWLSIAGQEMGKLLSWTLPLWACSSWPGTLEWEPWKGRIRKVKSGKTSSD